MVKVCHKINRMSIVFFNSHNFVIKQGMIGYFHNNYPKCGNNAPHIGIIGLDKFCLLARILWISPDKLWKTPPTCGQYAQLFDKLSVFQKFVTTICGGMFLLQPKYRKIQVSDFSNLFSVDKLSRFSPQNKCSV